jgi:glycosyltransferase involved in cell wall biosynthesis
VRVLLLTRYSAEGASSRIRFLQYVPHLRSSGIDVEVAPLLPDDYLSRRYSNDHPRWRSILSAYWARARRLAASGGFDLFWIEYELFPWMPVWFEQLLGGRGLRYLVEYDDAVFHRYDEHRSAVIRMILGGKIDAVMRRALAVVAGNTYLADRARAAGASRVEIIPSVVDLTRYMPRDERRDRPFTIGWIGSPTTARYVTIAAAGLEPAIREGAARLVLVGAGRNPVPDIPVEVVPWTEAGEADAINDFDVGVLPLSDGSWERGKCGYKLIQYFACAKPAIASPVGVNGQIVRHGENGFLASTPAEWTSAVQALKQDPMMCQRFGHAGRALVEREYSLQVMAPRVAALLLDLRARPEGRADVPIS